MAALSRINYDTRSSSETNQELMLSSSSSVHYQRATPTRPPTCRHMLLICGVFVVAFCVTFTVLYNRFNQSITDQTDQTPINSAHKIRRLPHAIIIGARKSGTRALLEALALHPHIVTARYELHYFDQNDTYTKGVAWYKAQMPESTANQLTVEKTPAYFTSDLAPARVHAMNSSIKLILILREPVNRMISDYSQVAQNKRDRKKSYESFEHLTMTANGSLNLVHKPVRNSLYIEHIQPWLKYFPREQMLLVDGDRFVGDPLSELRRLEAFLGVQPFIHQQQIQFNATKGFYCFKRQIRKKPKCLGDTKGREHVFVSQDTKRTLRALLRPYNERFFDLMEESMPW